MLQLPEQTLNSQLRATLCKLRGNAAVLRAMNALMVHCNKQLLSEIRVQLAGLDPLRARPARDIAPCPAGLAPEKVARVKAYIEQHLAEPLHTDRLAGAIHMSPFHFSRTFKRATGAAPHAYVTLRRVERAKVLLADGRFTIVRVATEVGFRTQGHFTEVFRRVTGTTPRRFRVAVVARPGTS
jgi:AraC-like DNA-binding protein